MTVTADDLGALLAAGAPIAGPLGALLDGWHAETAARPGGSGLLHVDAGCAGDPVTLTGTAPVPAHLGDAPLLPCIDCVPIGRLSSFDLEMGGYARLVQVLEAGALLDRAARALGVGGDALSTAGNRLRRARYRLDPALFAHGRPWLVEHAGPQPGPLATWLEGQIRRMRPELDRLLARYAAVGVLEGLLARVAAGPFGSYPRTARPGADHYVGMCGPGEELVAKNAPRLVREMLLVHTPLRWLGAGRDAVALYRLPGELAAQVFTACGAEQARDGGPVCAGDDDRLLGVAAALFDGEHLGAPLADVRTALVTARDLLA